MSAISRIKQKFLQKNPTHQEQFVVPPDWVVAVADELDDMMAEIAKLKARSRKREE